MASIFKTHKACKLNNMVQLFPIAKIGRHFFLVLALYVFIALEIWSVPSQHLAFLFFNKPICADQIFLDVWFSTVAWLTFQVIHSGDEQLDLGKVGKMNMNVIKTKHVIYSYQRLICVCVCMMFTCLCIYAHSLKVDHSS